jgi:bifunctional non-homologous end joining protein LigD
LEALLRGAKDRVRFSATLGSDADSLIPEISKLRLEGLIGKRAQSRYEPGARSGAWIKLKIQNEQEFVIGGYTEPSGSRKFFGGVLVGVYDGPKLTFVAKVGTGFDDDLLRSLYAGFQNIRQDVCPFWNLPEKRSGSFGQGVTATEMKRCRWIRPLLVCQVRFSEWTRDDRLRNLVFLGLRADKRAPEVVRERAT